MGMLDVVPNEEGVKLKFSFNQVVPVSQDAIASVPDESTDKPKKKRTTKKSETGMVTNEPEQSSLPMTMQSTPYAETFKETDNILRSVVAQIDQASYELSQDLNEIRASKTLRNKYTYISNLESSRSSLLSSKIAAVREMNSSIKSGHDLDLKRAKEMKLTQNEADDNKSIQDIYNAFVSMPVQQDMVNPYYNALGPSSMALTQNNANINPYLMNQQDPNIGYNNYLNNMSPEQMVMMIEENPHINHVIKYNATTGAAEFAVYDSQTNKFLDGIPTRSAEMYIPNMQFDFDRGIAVSNDLNETYSIVMTDSNGTPNKPDMSGY